MKRTYKDRDEFMKQFCGDPSKLDEKYDCMAFAGMTREALQVCLDKGWTTKDEAQNSAPNVGEILDFLKDNPAFKAHGYVVTAERQDARISVEGVQASGAPAEQVQEFINMFRHADNFDASLESGDCFAWFD